MKIESIDVGKIVYSFYDKETGKIIKTAGAKNYIDSYYFDDGFNKTKNKGGKKKKKK